MADRSRDYDRDRDRDRDRARDDRRPAKDMPRFTGREDSRVGDHEFTFEHPYHPHGGDSYRPGGQDDRDDRLRSRAPPSGPRAGRGRGGGGIRGGRGGGYGRGRGSDGKQFTFTPPVPAHERPILYFDAREKTPELMAGMALGSGDRFKEDVEEEGEEQRQDDGEVGAAGDEGDKDAPMEISDNEGELQETARIVDAEGDAKLEKKPDVISMIRAFKSKVAATQRNAVAENDDFIPLSFDDDDGGGAKDESEFELEPEQEQGRKMRKTNDGRRIVEHHGRDRGGEDPDMSGFSHRDHHYQERQPARDVGPPGATAAGPSASLPPPPSLGDRAKGVAAGVPPKPAQTSFQKGNDMPWPPPPPMDLPPPPPPPPPSNRPLTHIDLPMKRKYADFSVRGNGQTFDGNIKEKYRVPLGSKIDPVPWVKAGGDHSRCHDMTDWLHKEITDFISYIQPRAYEHAVRRDLVHRIRTAVARLWPDTDVRVFGSFAAELYLPTSDVDLVVVSESFAWYDVPKYSSKGSLARLGSQLREMGMTHVQVVGKAKVPIVKCIDVITGISVDISFENASGMVANDTFQKWKRAYPAMPILVLLIKHFLSMRGLNEPYVGGLGSFSVTCLVISLLQLLPSVRSGRIDPRLHLGVILLEFLELYGKNFNTELVGIRVDEDAPGYFLKKGVFTANERMAKPYQLVIQDPNDPNNDVSKSSFGIRLILACFAEAYDALITQMSLLNSLPFSQRVGRSVLGVIIGGNYDYAENQRMKMQCVYVSRIGALEGVDENLKTWTEADKARKAKADAAAEGRHRMAQRYAPETTKKYPDAKKSKAKMTKREAKRAKRAEMAQGEAKVDKAIAMATQSEAAYKAKGNNKQQQQQHEVIVID